MHRSDQLQNDATSVLVNESSHRCILQKLQLVAQMDKVKHLRVTNGHCFPKLDLIFQEMSEIARLSITHPILTLFSILSSLALQLLFEQISGRGQILIGCRAFAAKVTSVAKSAAR